MGNILQLVKLMSDTCRELNHFFFFLYSVIPVGMVDDAWHHMCVTWEKSDELLNVYKDGERKYQSDGFRTSLLKLGIQGNITSYTKILQECVTFIFFSFFGKSEGF